MSDLNITFLGTSAAVPTAKRNVSAVAVQHEGTFMLFDCGEGTQRQMQRFTGLKNPDAIFITHYHPDHWLGLPGLIASLAMNEQPQPVKVFGPRDGLSHIKGVCKSVGSAPSFVEFHPLGPNEVEANAFYGKGFKVWPYRTGHTNNSQGYVLEEPTRPGRFDPALAQSLGLAPKEFGELQRGESVKGIELEDVTGPERRGRRVVITGDSPPAKNLSPDGPRTDVLIHEATFSDLYVERAKKTKHSTGRQAGQVAALGNVDRLYLTHFSPREDVRRVLQEAAEEFSPVEAAIDGKSITVEFPR